MSESLPLLHHHATTPPLPPPQPPPSSATAATAATARLLLAAPLILLALYLWNLNRLLTRTPPEVAHAVPQKWTTQQLRETYERLRRNPITTASYAAHLPPRLARRYIVTGGSGLVGGHIVLQLLERGQPPEGIRIVDFQPPHRADMVDGPTAHGRGPVTQVRFRRTDIASADATEAAFGAPWDEAVADWPLTVFHTAAVIIPSARSARVNGFCEAVNVQGTRNVLAAARRAGADVFVSTSSASIAIRRVRFWAHVFQPWRWPLKAACASRSHILEFPPNFWQVLDESDFDRPLRPHDEFFGNYPASKAKAERLVCAANSSAMRTGCVRPGNGVYGHPTDNLLGTPLALEVYPTWVSNIVQNFVHGINCALAHLQFEAILAKSHPHAPQAGRPFCITDPGPPIYYDDMYHALQTLVVTPFRLLRVPPVPMLLLSYAIEFYNLLPARVPLLQKAWWPTLPGGAAHLQPGLFSICTHLLTDMRAAQRSVRDGGLGYRGVVTTLEGMCQEILDWNLEQEAHARAQRVKSGKTKNDDDDGGGGDDDDNDNDAAWSKKPGTKLFRTSILLAEEIQKLGGVAQAVKP